MAAIDTAPTSPTTTALAGLVGVTDRTLLRTFHETYGLPPKQYLMLRELHRIRRILRTGATDDATVADVLALHGIWEFGRFAARYRRQFGELPSDTLRHARA
jgi:methylphosphotriester-DNA--protein-cysteine methyltransferase